jgi:Ca-activated chloride channel homolog
MTTGVLPMRGWLAVIPGFFLLLTSCGASQQQAASSFPPSILGVQNLSIPPSAAQGGGTDGGCFIWKSEALREQPGYHELTVSVESHTDAAPSTLTSDDFRLFQGKNEIPIKYFRQEPASVGILVDTSGSMGAKLHQAQNAIEGFINDLNPQDDVFLVAFSSSPFLLQPFTTNHQLVIQRLSLLHAFGQTALFDTIQMGLLTVRHGCSKKKALFIITDGIDNSSEATQKEVIARAQIEKVPIYSIGIGESNYWTGPPYLGLVVHARESDAVDTKTLQALSSETGAKTYLIHEVGDGKELTADAKAIAAAIGDHYIVGYVASGANQNDLRLELRNRSDLTLNVESVSITAVKNAAPPPH